ncbi:hypothetical protein [Streptomyces boninensis]|uniref:hypothetical protein n=1 Tax=Streptomyces boninensis TaxID=2039455 RepID=UPI003B21B157
MRTSRAIGAAGLALAAVAVLAGCTDQVEDKAFGGLGDMGDGPGDVPTLPSGGPSLSTPGGLSSGGSTSGGSTSGGGAGSPSAVPSTPPTYNSDALSEVIGQNCRYSRERGIMSFDVNIQNASADVSFTYSYTVTFKVGQNANSTVASRTIGSKLQSATVTPGGDRKLTVEQSHTTNDRLVYSCQVTSARKNPA